jgi:hypothetical protein
VQNRLSFATQDRADARLRRDLIGAHCECYYSGVVSTFSYSGRSVACQQLLATSLRLDNTAPPGVGHLCAPGLLLAKSGFGRLNNTVRCLPSAAGSWVRKTLLAWASAEPGLGRSSGACRLGGVSPGGSGRLIALLCEFCSASWFARSASSSSVPSALPRACSVGESGFALRAPCLLERLPASCQSWWPFRGDSWAGAAAAAGAWVWPKLAAALSLCGCFRARRVRRVWVAWGGPCIGAIQGRAAVVSAGACRMAVGGGKGCQRSSSALAALAALAAAPPWGSCRGPGLSCPLLGARSARPCWTWPPRPAFCFPVVASLPSVVADMVHNITIKSTETP